MEVAKRFYRYRNHFEGFLEWWILVQVQTPYFTWAESNANEGEQRILLICIRFGSCEVRRMNLALLCGFEGELWGKQLGDRIREHPRDVEKDDKNASKPVARHFKLPNHSKQHMAVCGLFLHQGSTESRKTLEQKLIFQIGTLNPHGINERFSFN